MQKSVTFLNFVTVFIGLWIFNFSDNSLKEVTPVTNSFLDKESESSQDSKAENDELVVSDWFEPTFNQNPNTNTDIKISDGRIDASVIESNRVLVYGKGLLGTYRIPYSFNNQQYGFTLSKGRLKLFAKSDSGNKEVFNCFGKLRYVILPENSLEASEADFNDYYAVAAYFEFEE